MIPPIFSANSGDINCCSKCPINMATINVVAEQQAIMMIDFKGIRIFLSPYVNPTLKLSKLTANANNISENNCVTWIPLLSRTTTIVYEKGLSNVNQIC